MVTLRPPERPLHALASLTKTSSGQVLLAWLQEIHEEQKRELMTLQPPQLQQAQGAAMFLADFLEVAKKSPALAEK